MNYRKVVYVITALLVLFFISVKVYYSIYPNQLSFHPSDIAIVRENSNCQKFISRTSDEGKDILQKAYGSYTDYIVTHPEIDISTPLSAEFTLPQMKVDDEVYILREHPSLRYHLWKKDAPDVVLLGSSVFFCGFNRETFFQIHPELKLLDFTTGNNTPFIAYDMLHYADSLGLQFKPNTIFLYGMNRVEMLAKYKGRAAHDLLRDVINNRVTEGEKSSAAKISDFTNLSNLKFDLNNYFNKTYSKLFIPSVYKREIPGKYLHNAEKLRTYLMSKVDAPDISEKTFDEERILELRKLAQLLQKHKCRLVILKMPLSVYTDRMLNITKQPSYFDIGAKEFNFPNTEYLDVSDNKKVGITELDFVWPGNVFDPEHLNFQGADKFTRYITANIIDSSIHKEF